ncbi:Protein TolB [bacterium HR16]|nr:Protein TolB [bacterium HR16]
MRRISFLPVALILFCLPLWATPEPGEEEFEQAMETLYQVGGAVWQPNGEWILFVRYAPDNGPSRIYKIRPDGTGLTAITPEWYANPVWSPDSTKFACVGGTETTDELYVIDVDGNHLRSLGYHPGFLGFEGWSPDGSMIAFTTRRGDGGPYVALMTGTGEEIRFVCTGYSAAWHPSGRYLVVEDSVGNGPVTYLFEVDVQTKQRRQITFGVGCDSVPVYSPDGEWIAFLASARWQPGTRGSPICLVRRNGNDLHVLEIDEEDYAYTAPSVSPDGQYLVFGRGKWVPTDLYICRVDGTGLRKLTNFYPDGQAKRQGTLKVAKASFAPKVNAKPSAPAKPSPPAKPAKPAKKEKKEKKGAPLPLLAPPIPLKRH